MNKVARVGYRYLTDRPDTIGEIRMKEISIDVKKGGLLEDGRGVSYGGGDHAQICKGVIVNILIIYLLAVNGRRPVDNRRDVIEGAAVPRSA